MVKVLGVNWNIKIDILLFLLVKFIKEINYIEKVFKRLVLSLFLKLYDFLGFVELVIVKVKIMMQELWKYSLLWDKEFFDSFKENQVKWLNEL